MRRVFADAHYWVALINNQDQSHPAAKAISRTLQATMILQQKRPSPKFWRIQ
jgi:hypothetical protein